MVRVFALLELTIRNKSMSFDRIFCLGFSLDETQFGRANGWLKMMGVLVPNIVIP